MASKRVMESVSSTSYVKKIKVDGDDGVIEITDDVNVESIDVVDKVISMHLMYDRLFDDFYVSLKKSAEKEEERRILLNPENLRKLVEKMEKMTSLARRYQSAGREVSFEFDLGSNISVHLDFNTYTTIDIRKYFLKDGKILPTRAGVRFGTSHIPKLKEAVEKIVRTIETVQECSTMIMTKCRNALIVREIDLLHGLEKPFCEGCKVMHPSQSEHMHENGCLNPENPCWDDVVDYFFSQAYDEVNEKDCLELAEKYCKMMNIPLIRPVIKDETMGEIKAFIMIAKTTSDTEFKEILKI